LKFEFVKQEKDEKIINNFSSSISGRKKLTILYKTYLSYSASNYGFLLFSKFFS